MASHLLLVTDDWLTKKPLKSVLLERGIHLTPMSSAEFLKAQAALPEKLDVIVMDLERCLSDSAALCRAAKRDRPLKELPLILLMTETQLPAMDLRWGFDDYLTLPLSGARLAERLNFLLWKLHGAKPEHGFSHNGLVIDFERYEVHVHGEPIDLTYKEFELLKFLATHPGKVFTREALLDKVWGYDYYGGTRTVDVHIRRLRSKIDTGPTPYIDTVRHVGYKFLIV